jgi:hypothetical protein
VFADEEGEAAAIIRNLGCHFLLAEERRRG